MPAIPKHIIPTIRGRLSRRIVFWIFISVIVIETIILIPSFKKREKELLTQLKDISIAKISLILQLSSNDLSDQQLFKQIQRIQQHLPDRRLHTLGHVFTYSQHPARRAEERSSPNKQGVR